MQTRRRAVLLFTLMTVAFLAVASPAWANTFTVNSIGDDGDAAPNGVCDTTPFPVGTEPVCTLRAAIEEANVTAGADFIGFDIPDSLCDATTKVCTISPTSKLPRIKDAVTIDGYTQGDGTAGTTADDATENTIPLAQDGTNAVLKIELDGTNAGTGSNINGLTIAKSGVLIMGLVINRFEDAGIALVSQPSGTRVKANIEGNFYRYEPRGRHRLANGGGAKLTH